MRQTERSKTGGWTSATMILGGEVAERLATLGITMNLVTYLTGTMHLGNADSANIVTNFVGTSFMLCLFGGFLGDTYVGRYLNIAVFAAVQASGVSLLTISTIIPSLRPPACLEHTLYVQANTKQLMVLFVGLYVTVLGTGGLKSSVPGFGSDQFDATDKQEKKQMIKFLNWFYFFANLGSLMAVTVLVFIQDHQGKSANTGSFKRNILRPTSPKSPVASASAFESVEGSDDGDDLTAGAKMDSTYLHTNGDAII